MLNQKCNFRNLLMDTFTFAYPCLDNWSCSLINHNFPPSGCVTSWLLRKFDRIELLSIKLKSVHLKFYIHFSVFLWILIYSNIWSCFGRFALLSDDSTLKAKLLIHSTVVTLLNTLLKLVLRGLLPCFCCAVILKLLIFHLS